LSARCRRPGCTRLVLPEWGLAALNESLELVVSELLTDGVLVSRTTGHFAPVV
jgi:hypothetical protein